MEPLFPLAPRYRLDDENPWLRGIDPARRYWLWVNGDDTVCTTVPGLSVSSFGEFKQAILRFRDLQSGDRMELRRVVGGCTIHCISSNCYAISDSIDRAPVWHLFDRETLESLLMTAHPDWQCAPSDIELGRDLMEQMFARSMAA
ncbi:MAG: hypothetical protein J7641_20585 [Cyanobacteria bacterium SID2]|nr:hypothetical protein [Cyanobacteria bacterium SID2]MBP0003491.1 hypothetical protein [Cyanobacteria bacterium SBC]